VLLVVDQFRGDYPAVYGDRWTHGLRRLLDEGAVFRNAAYTFGRTTTCGGHATIVTGLLPRSHGIIDNQWWDRDRRATVTCAQDPSVTPVGIDGPGAGAAGPAQLDATAIGNVVQASQNGRGRVLAISPKARTAVMLAGRGGPGVLALWAENSGHWSTSSAYATPWPEVMEYARAHPIARSYGTVWNYLLPAEAYRFDDDAPGEAKPRVFPHPLSSASGKPDAAFYNAWMRSPWSDRDVAEFGAAMVEALDLGQRDAVDVLALGFSALDVVGHDYGPHSHEVQDVLARLDRAIGTFVDALDRHVGRHGYVLALSSDHGVSPLPEQAALHGFDGGRAGSSDIRQTLEAALSGAFGKGAYVPAVYGTNVYLGPGILDRIERAPAIQSTVTRALMDRPGVYGVYWRWDLVSSEPTSDPVLAALRASHHPVRGCDLVVLPKPYWLFRPDDADHGTPHDYDVRVPLVFYGGGIAPGAYDDAASPADIVPTIASLIGVPLPRADGRPLARVTARR
jgi:hypothetical protein